LNSTVGQLGLDHVRQLEVLEEVIHEFFARQLEDEIVFAGLLAVAGAAAAAAAAAAARTVDLVAFLVFGIAGVDGFPDAAMGVAEVSARSRP
jgi:catalase (peroxidase I)